jgi:hypothetical protein
MTPKQKAEELVDKYRIFLQNTDTEVGEEILCTLVAKSCALIAVDEILNNNNKIPGNVNGLHTFENTSYWQEVKQEIEKL